MLTKIKNLFLFFNGPYYDLGESVVVINGQWLRLPRKIKAIGWNNTGGYFFYGLDGLKNEVFKETDIRPAAHMRKVLFFEKDATRRRVNDTAT